MSRVIENLSNRNIIKISNDFAWAQINIQEVSLNIFLMLLTELDIEDKELPIFDIAILDIEKKLGKKLNRKQSKLDNIIQDFLGKNLQLDNGTEFISLCSECEIIIEKNMLFLRIKINPLLKEEFLNLTKNFTKINLKHILPLRGINVKRMYMILRKMAQLNNWDTQFETLLTMLNSPASHYKYGNFKAQVLTPSVEQINNLEDKEMTISYTMKAIGARKIKTLEFKIKLIKKVQENMKTYQTVANKKKSTQNKILDEWLKKSQEEDRKKDNDNDINPFIDPLD